jgi:hypothetical protein
MNIQDIVEAFGNKRIVVFTGAGISASSGLGTFRGTNQGSPMGVREDIFDQVLPSFSHRAITELVNKGIYFSSSLILRVWPALSDVVSLLLFDCCSRTVRFGRLCCHFEPRQSARQIWSAVGENCRVVRQRVSRSLPGLSRRVSTRDDVSTVRSTL